MNVFVTGFGPFLTVTENPSETLARNCGWPFQSLEVTFSAVDDFLDRGFPREAFDALLMIGVARRAKIQRLERRGVNWVGSAPDVDGFRRSGRIDANGPDELGSTLWRRGDAKHCHMAYSDHAGDYLCNYALFQALRALPDHQVGFLHIPTFHQMNEAEQGARLHRLLERISAR